jgi:hypothetical protein
VITVQGQPRQKIHETQCQPKASCEVVELCHPMYMAGSDQEDRGSRPA